MEYRVIAPSDPEYPRKAKERLGDKAPTIYYNGNLELLNRFTMSVLCSDESHGTELWETNDILFTIREYDLNYLGSWHSIIETEIFRVGLFKGFGSERYRPKKQPLLGEKTVTLFSAKGLKNESYESYLLDRFYPPLHQFPERDEYFRQAEAGELLMLSICDPDDGRQSRKNIMERNWMACVLGDVVFIPYGPKGTKTYTTAKKVVEANIPAFTIDHATSADLHKLGIPGFNRKTVKAFLEQRGAKRGDTKNKQDISGLRCEPGEYKAPVIEKPAQAQLNFKKTS
ncbi:MAG: hypothetical protein M1508_07280 [Nitrospirae bacterium]|nr:hypothetical protein [Nitrospirota bacterium]MCL5422414.1 hypothetical protein [Nitrospirota bacterium]